MPSTCNGLSTKRLFREEQNPRRRDATKVDLSETKRALSRWRQTIQELGGTATFILLPGHTRECLRTRNGGCPSSNVHCPIGRSTIVTFLFRHPVRDYVWQRAGAHLRVDSFLKSTRRPLVSIPTSVYKGRRMNKRLIWVDADDFSGWCCSSCDWGMTTPHLESTVAALAFNRLAQESFEKHSCVDGTCREPRR
jgi:hypothetical protein